MSVSSWLVSGSDPPSESSAATWLSDTWARTVRTSMVVQPSCSATSSSVTWRMSCCSSSRVACSTMRALERTDRGTQSAARSSSMIAPRTRVAAYVSNLKPRSDLEALNGVDEAEHAVRDEVAELDGVGQPADHAHRNLIHERRVVRDERLARLGAHRAAVAAEVLPQAAPARRLVSAVTTSSFSLRSQDGVQLGHGSPQARGWANW